MKRSKFLTVITIFAPVLVLLTVFQNCGSTDAGFNPLYDNILDGTCEGVNCDRDLNNVNFKVLVSGILIDNLKTGQAATDPVCGPYNCFDVGGFCDKGGYPGSVFLYQWTLAGQAPQPEIRTSATCDDNGRFQIQVRVPAAFDYTKAHSLRVLMKVIDDRGVEIVNPSGAAAWSFLVTVRTL